MAKRIWHTLFQRALLGIVILIIVLLAQKSTFVRVFTEIQKPVAFWEATSVYNNLIGDAMKVKVTVVTSQGMVIDLSRLYDVGDIWNLPFKEVPISPLETLSSPNDSVYQHNNEGTKSMIDEGEMEVRSRKIEQFHDSEKVYTVITYELQYMLPLDWEVTYDDKSLPVYVPMIINYWYYDAKENTLEKRIAWVTYNTETIYLYHRVDENSEPLFNFYEMPMPERSPLNFETLGFGLIGLAALLIVRRCILLIQSTLKEISHELPDQLPTVEDYYDLWQKQPRYETFVEAVICFRKTHRGKKHLWWKTTVVLYSGIVFDDRQVQNLFNEMLKEE